MRTLDFGSFHIIDLKGESPSLTSSKKYFEFNYNIDSRAKETEIAERLAEAFKNAMNKRSLPLFGTTAMALSGGLDSRALLCSITDRGHVKTFCFFDEENLEYQIAKQIAQTAGVELIPLKRDFDHYGCAAAKGIEISGGMGGAFNNHFLGFRDTFKQLGFENLITGFYCDYYFKALALDRHKSQMVPTRGSWGNISTNGIVPAFGRSRRTCRKSVRVSMKSSHL